MKACVLCGQVCDGIICRSCQAGMVKLAADQLERRISELVRSKGPLLLMMLRNIISKKL